MPRVRTLQRAFTGGVISPALWGHIEDAKFQTGAAVMENMVPWPQGKLAMRPGTEFVNETADSSKTSVLRAFGAGSSQGYAVGIETGRFRFYLDGAVLTWATTHLIASIDTGTEYITFDEAHGFTANQRVRFIIPAGATAPTGAGFTTTADMFVILVSTTVIQVSATSFGGAVNFTAAGSGSRYVVATSAMPEDYVASQNISSIDTVTNELDTIAHNFANGDPIEVTYSVAFTAAATNICTATAHGFISFTAVTVSSSGTLPGGLTADTTYYVWPLDANTFYLATTTNNAALGSFGAVDITDTGSGTHTLTLKEGEQIFASTPPIYIGTTYYARSTGTDAITVHATAAAAIAGTGAFDLTGTGAYGAGSLAGRIHFAYQQGDLVNSPNSGIYYSEIAHPQENAPGSSAWYLMPPTGEYEIPNPYVETNLLNIDRDQIADTLTLTHPDHGNHELSRVSDLRWTFTPVTLGPVLDPPENVNAAATLGEYLACTFSNASPAVFTVLPQAHGFALNVTTLYVTVLTGTITGFTSGMTVVTTSPAVNTFTLRNITGGATIDSSSTGTARVQPCSIVTELVNTYYVTALRADGSESLVSLAATVTNNLFVAGAYNTITWNAVSGAERYRIYKAQNGLAGAIGETDALTFRDDDIAPDMSVTPPQFDDTIGGAGQEPGAIASFEQRRVFSGVEADPQQIWFTELGTIDSMVYHLPILDTDRIKFELSSPLTAKVRFIAPMANLVILTESTEFVMTTVDSEALTPTSFRARPVSYVGCSVVKPLPVNDKLIFCGNRGGHVYEFSLRAAFEGYRPVDVCLRAPHLFDGFTIVDAAQQKSPLPVLWFVRSDGALLGYTYSPEEEVSGWHIHTTNGTFERVCVIAEGDEDRIYVIVKRTINSQTKRYVERFAPFLQPEDIADAYHVDCGIAYSGASASTVSGYDHLEGEAVVGNVDGYAQMLLDVSSGDVALDAAGTSAIIGLSYTGTFQSLPMAATADGASAQGRVKGANRAWARVLDSGEFRLGVTDTESEMVTAGTIGELTTDEARIVLPGTWSEGGQIFIQQPNPLPLNLVQLTVDVEMGGG